MAPSPTGRLHLGNAWTFLFAWLAARKENGRVILRIEDIDTTRCRGAYVDSIIEDLKWLGLDWDYGPGSTGQDTDYHAIQYCQSQRLDQYRQALDKLVSAGLVYQCFCSRKELQSLASAPHLDDIGFVYPGTCRYLDDRQKDRLTRAGKKACLRFLCHDDKIFFQDKVFGRQEMTLAECGGDFPVQRADGVFAYQMATAVDDALMGIDLVVRGRDLLYSTPRQIAIIRSIGSQPPEYAHLPLLLDENGERLAKRHQSLSIAHLRESGINAWKIIGLLAFKAGMNPEKLAIKPIDIIANFSFTSFPKQDCMISNMEIQQILN